MNDVQKAYRLIGTETGFLVEAVKGPDVKIYAYSTLDEVFNQIRQLVADEGDPAEDENRPEVEAVNYKDYPKGYEKK